MNNLPKSTPEAEGIASAAIMEFVTEAEQTIHELHSLVLLRHGKIIAEGWWTPYQPDDPHILFSVSKSFTSTAVGLAVTEGKMQVDDPVISFFPELQPDQVSDNLAAMQVRHLLTMTTGHSEDTMDGITKDFKADWVQAFLALPVPHVPGTHFLYNTGATYVLSAIVQRVTGQTLLDYLQPRLFTPLGIERPTWEFSPQGINMGGFGLSLTTSEVARFGQLYLQKGEWQGERLLPQSWIEEATAAQVPNGDATTASDWAQGYGYQFWRCRYGAYRADGAFGQFCIVLPEQDAVLAFTAGLDDMQLVLDLVWKRLLPAFGATALPPNPSAHEAVASKLEQLALPTVAGQPLTATATRIAGKRFVFEENKQQLRSLSLDFDQQGNSVLSLKDDSGRSHQLECGSGKWHNGTTTLDWGNLRRVGACGGWVDEDTYQIQLYYLTSSLPDPPPLRSGMTPFGLTITCHFVENRVMVDQQASQSFFSTKRPRLEGKLHKD